MRGHRLEQLLLADGTLLHYEFTHPIITFSLYWLILAMLSIADKEPTWLEEHGLPI